MSANLIVKHGEFYTVVKRLEGIDKLYLSFWTLVDAVNYCKYLVEKYPNDYDYINGQFVDVNVMLKDGLQLKGGN